MACSQSDTQVVCSFQFNNLAIDDFYLLKRNTPLEGLLSPFIAVKHNDDSTNVLEYEGPYVYQAPLTLDDFILINAGESIKTIIQVNDAFSFSFDDVYSIEYTGSLYYLPKNRMEMEVGIGNIINVELNEISFSKSVSIELEGVSSFAAPIQFREEIEVKEEDIVHVESCSSAGFIGGTGGERENTTKAHRELCEGAINAEDRVRKDRLYKTWFGRYSRRRASRVREVYWDIETGLYYHNVSYYIRPSRCRSNWYAYTYYGSDTVYLCDAYFQEPVYCRTDGNSMEGTLVQMWSYAIGYTRNYAYGERNVKKLAKRYPWKAVNNADTYDFYYCRAKEY